MILKDEIFSIAKRKNLQPTTIEKDYVLSWVLAGIRQHPKLAEILTFKGGTCLKKCYFGEDYRYSEDLDFTLLDPDYDNLGKLQAMFKSVCEWVTEETNIEIPTNMVSVEKHLNLRGNVSFRGNMRYRGPLKHKTNIPKIKIDITVDEYVVCTSLPRKILHEYSDELATPSDVLSYTFEEIFAEKIRALFQRTRPRDLYDVISLHEQKKWTIDQSNIVKILRLKCEHANIKTLPTKSILEEHPHHLTLVSEWQNMLGHQIANLKPVEYYLERLEKVLGWLAG